MDGRGVLHGNNADKERDEERVGGGDDADREIFLSREEFAMLQAFHRAIPVPALAANILQVYVDEDLEVPDASDGTPETARGHHRPVGVDQVPVVRSSPLTRRLSKQGSARKPHVEIDLTPHTPKQDQGRATSFAAGAAQSGSRSPATRRE